MKLNSWKLPFFAALYSLVQGIGQTTDAPELPTIDKVELSVEQFRVKQLSFYAQDLQLEKLQEVLNGDSSA